MKRITPYKNFLLEARESDNELETVKYLEDIFQELSDIGFTCYVYIFGGIYIDIYKPQSENNGWSRSYFKFGAVKDYTLSAIDYMESRGWVVDNYDCGNTYITANKYEDNYDTDRVRISFTKG